MAETEEFVKNEGVDDTLRKTKKKKYRMKKNKDDLNRKARLIIRNLPFKCTEDSLRQYLSEYGEIDDINLLRKPDGKLVGCGFVQFRATQMAAMAIYHTNGQQFMNREIKVDWAVPKSQYEKSIGKKTEGATSDVIVKEEPLSDDESKDIVTDFDQPDVKEEETVKDESDKSDASDSDSEEQMSDNVSQISEVKSESQRWQSNDVTEGKTVFVKNIPFHATNDDLKECMRQFGPVYYALICVDKLTEHSKGTGFVKFVNKEDADKCLEAGTELTLFDNILDCHSALDRKSVQEKKENTKTQSKDSRNLYLIKEGVILAGTKAAEGVSAADMTKRLQLEQWKTQMLRNLNMFVSRIRLIMYNIPLAWDDSKLRALFMKHAGPKAVIKEARIMRDMRSLDSKGVGLSKGYGFVTFTDHKDALTVLRSLNNNPDVFSPTKRPIVAFSIENKVMINARQKRLQKSKLKNPNFKEYDPKLENSKNNKKKFSGKKNVSEKTIEPEKGEEKKYSGVAARPGTVKLRSKFKLKTQAQTHFENLKNEKKKQKIKNLRKQEPIRQPRQKQNTNTKKRKDNDDNFSKLVDKYKNSLKTVTLKKTKWYEQ